MQRVRLGFLLAAVLLAAATSTARGQVVVATNFGGPPRTGPSGFAYQAQSFTAGPTNLALTRISSIFQLPSGPLSVDMALYSDAGGQPGSLVFDLGTQAISTTIAQNDWNSPGVFTLVANTTYWAVAYEATAGNVWFSTNQPQTGGVGVLGGAQTSSDGTTWASFRQALLFEVRGTSIAVVPEPGPLASGGGGGGAVAAVLVGCAAAWRRRG
ncbi:MAG: choice-of-anchor R domain-containing protein [Isosphaeraceae bacterium]